MKLVNDTRTKRVTPLESQKLETRTQDKEAEIIWREKEQVRKRLQNETNAKGPRKVTRKKHGWRTQPNPMDETKTQNFKKTDEWEKQHSKQAVKKSNWFYTWDQVYKTAQNFGLNNISTLTNKASIEG